MFRLSEEPSRRMPESFDYWKNCHTKESLDNRYNNFESSIKNRDEEILKLNKLQIDFDDLSSKHNDLISKYDGLNDLYNTLLTIGKQNDDEHSANQDEVAKYNEKRIDIINNHYNILLKEKDNEIARIKQENISKILELQARQQALCGQLKERENSINNLQSENENLKRLQISQQQDNDNKIREHKRIIEELKAENRQNEIRIEKLTGILTEKKTLMLNQSEQMTPNYDSPVAHLRSSIKKNCSFPYLPQDLKVPLRRSSSPKVLYNSHEISPSIRSINPFEPNYAGYKSFENKIIKLMPILNTAEIATQTCPDYDEFAEGILNSLLDNEIANSLSNPTKIEKAENSTQTIPEANEKKHEKTIAIYKAIITGMVVSAAALLMMFVGAAPLAFLVHTFATLSPILNAAIIAIPTSIISGYVSYQLFKPKETVNTIPPDIAVAEVSNI